MTKMTKIVPATHPAEFARVPGNVTINDLPDELIISIARFITLNFSGNAQSTSDMRDNSLTILRLSLCSRRFHSLVEPVLYERFHGSWRGSPAYLEGFLLRLMKRPDLARRVRFIRWRDILGYSFPLDCFEGGGWKEARDRIMGPCESPAERDTWVDTVEETSLEALVAVLLILAPNLEELIFNSGEPVGPEPPVLRWMAPQIRRLQLEKQLENPASLWNLRSVRLEMSPTVGYDPHCLIQLMTIPSVEIFRVSNLHESVLSDFLHSNDLVLENIKELQLSFHCTDPDIFRRFLCRLLSLKRLYCSIDGQGDFKSYPPDLIFVPPFLEPQLEDLAISDYATLIKGTIAVQRRLKSLASFTNLRTLKTSWGGLVGQEDIGGDLARSLSGKDVLKTSRPMADVLPTSLERLHLLGHCKSALAVISELLKQKHRFPRLKYLNIGWQCILYHDTLIPEDPYSHINFSKAESLECLAMCREVGVEMEMWTMRKERETTTHTAKDEQDGAMRETL
ncbi:hypothetical protein V492_05162 [Pseudogymnoascus sp. VKM F-4246]|nr:hypothetical protein V492_05162 [Pseudogymnoascus sp. VKM F-4246]